MHHASKQDTGELQYWIRLVHTTGVGPATARQLLAAFGLPENIFSATYAGLLKVVPERVAQALQSPPDADLQQKIASTIAWAAAPGNHVLTLADSDYPASLLDTEDPPALLYAKGNIGLLRNTALAVVGSRNATRQGLEDAEEFAAAFSAAGLSVVSGLALGIDTAAHVGALRTTSPDSGATIAVIGTGADIVYPSRNRTLAHRIAESGLILSEYALGTPAIASNFPRRNRLISGLSHGVLVVEAAAQSGSLITARMALEQGRDVFAIPGSIHSPLSKGCHQLIKQGAKLVESAQDVLEEVRGLSTVALTQTAGARAAPPRAKDMRVPAAAAATATVPKVESTFSPLLELIGFDPVDINLLAHRAGLDAATVSSQLLTLEMQGLIESLPGSRWRRLARRSAS